MSLSKRNTARKVPPKKIKDNVNSALKNVTKPENALLKADSSIRSGNPVPPPVAKELLSNFYDLVLCKYDAHEPLPKTEEVAPEIAEARFAKPRPNSKKNSGSAGHLPIPCTSDICSKVRQLVQMNNKVQNFKKKFLDVSPDIDEKRALQQRKLKIGNEYSKRNASKKVASKIDKIQKTADEGGYGCEATKTVSWGPKESVNQSNDLERQHSRSNFADSLDDDLSSSPDSFSDGFQHNFRKEKHYDTDYASCIETDYANSSRNSSATFIRQSSSARMLVHFRELLSMHILPKSADEIRCSILSDEDIAFLQTLVEADERYHCLKKEDHNLLKDILRSQLKQIETHERILAETLKRLRQKSGSSEDISVSLNAFNKEKAEQPLEMSEKKEPPYEVILRDLLKMPEETSDPHDKESLKLLKTSKSTENAKNESTNLPAAKDLENNSLNQSVSSCPSNNKSDYFSFSSEEIDSVDLPPSLQVQFAEDELKDPSFAILAPLISYPPSPCESPKYPRRCEESSVKITEAKTEPYEDPELVVPPLDLDKINDEPVPGFFKRSFNWFSASERKVRNKKNPSSQNNGKSVSARLEKTENSEEKNKCTLSSRNKSEDIKQFRILVEKQRSDEINRKILDDPKVVEENQSKNSQDPAALFGSAPLRKKILETSLGDLKKHVDVLEANQVTKEIVDSESIKSTAKLIIDAISQKSEIYSKAKVHRPSRDQETNTVITLLKCDKYLKISFEYMVFWENLATTEVYPLFVARRRHIAKEFRMKYIPIDELNNAGEFFILNSECSEITVEKTNFQTLHTQPEKLTKLLQGMYKQPVDKAVSTSDDESNYKFLYPWQISDYAVSEDIMIQKVICCLFKTWATYPELYKQTISNCKVLVPSQPQLMPSSKENVENKEDNSVVLETNPGIGDQIKFSSDNNKQKIAKNKLRNKKSITKQNKEKRRKFKENLTPKNLLVWSAQFLLFTALVLGLSIFQYKCLD